MLDGANYIGVGPTFRFGHKTVLANSRAPSCCRRAGRDSLAGLRHRRDHGRQPAAVKRAGFTRIAVSAAITAAPDPAGAAAQLRAALGD